MDFVRIFHFSIVYDAMTSSQSRVFTAFRFVAPCTLATTLLRVARYDLDVSLCIPDLDPFFTMPSRIHARGFLVDNDPHGHARFRVYFQIINSPSMRITRDTIELLIVRVRRSGEFAEIINIEVTDMEPARRFTELSVSFTFILPCAYNPFRLFSEVRLMLQPFVVCHTTRVLAAQSIEVGPGSGLS